MTRYFFKSDGLQRVEITEDKVNELMSNPKKRHSLSTVKNVSWIETDNYGQLSVRQLIEQEVTLLM